MKVKELISELEKLNPDAEVITTSSNFELNGAMISAKSVRQYNEGSKSIETFRDAFDGGSYNKETWSIIGGKTPVVTIG